MDEVNGDHAVQWPVGRPWTGVRPRVTLHAVVSADGRILAPEDAASYDVLESQLRPDAVLISAEVARARAAAEGHDMTIDDPAGTPPPRTDPRGRPWLVLLDPDGEVHRWAWLRTDPRWRDVIVAVAAETPPVERERLVRHGVPTVVAGESAIEAFRLLTELAGREVTHVLLEGQDPLCRAALGAGLVDELSLVVHPLLLGSAAPPIDLVDATLRPLPAALVLSGVQRLPDGAIWLRYVVPTTL